MGFFDYLRGDDTPSSSQIDKAIKQVTQPHGDPAVRMAAADRLKAWGTAPAISGLLRRFTIQTPSGQLDQEECEQVEGMLVDLKTAAVGPIISFLERESNVAYPARALEKILPSAEYVERILTVLEKLEAGFGSHNAQRENLIRALEDAKDQRIAPALIRFIHDPIDDVAIAAVRTIVHMGSEPSIDNLIDLLVQTADRPRLRQEIADQLAASGWSAQSRRKEVEGALPTGFAIDKKGRVVVA